MGWFINKDRVRPIVGVRGVQGPESDSLTLMSDLTDPGLPACSLLHNTRESMRWDNNNWVDGGITPAGLLEKNTGRC